MDATRHIRHEHRPVAEEHERSEQDHDEGRVDDEVHGLDEGGLAHDLVKGLEELLAAALEAAADAVGD